MPKHKKFSLKTKYFVLVFFSLLGIIIFYSCFSNSDKAKEIQKLKDSLVYLNHSDSAKYVGINTCKQCHQSIYNSFKQTGMGKSFDMATKEKSSANFSKPFVSDGFTNLKYFSNWQKDSLFITEFRIENKDTIHQRSELVNFIIGSGQHTNSHLSCQNGYVHQMPMTFYTQKQKWDLPPGFENGVNTRFNRKIGLECMSCHNGYPTFEIGSENKYSHIPSGIDCERCHGPGSIHVVQRSTGSKIDTSKYIDYSIVNPAKLSIDLQFDICQRCHLQGNAVLKDGKSFYDFKPGKKLSDVLSVFLPKYKNADDEFIMASHADRLKQSACFIKSIEKAKLKSTNPLKPYKDAMTCITCHNPHVSVKQTNKNVFNDACNNCHNTKNNLITCSDEKIKSKINTGEAIQNLNCVSCHMPNSGSIDIPHVTVHDHYIRKPITQKQKEKVKEFIGLFAINEKNPSKKTRAKAYINQFEKFEQNKSFLDSANFLLASSNTKEVKENIHELVQIEFFRSNFYKISSLVSNVGKDNLLSKLLTKKSYHNYDAWACYRIAESYNYLNEQAKALPFFKQAVNLAPFNLDFNNKYGACLAQNNQLNDAETIFEYVLTQYPKNVSALTSLGYLKLVKGQQAEAFRLYKQALKLDPDYEQLLLNLAGYYLYLKDIKQCKMYLQRLLKINPNNNKAKAALAQIS